MTEAPHIAGTDEAEALWVCAGCQQRLLRRIDDEGVQGQTRSRGSWFAMTDVAIRRRLHDGLWNRFHDRQHRGMKLSISPYPPTSFIVVRNQHRLTYAYGAGQKLATVTLRFTHSQDTDRPTEWHALNPPR